MAKTNITQAQKLKVFMIDNLTCVYCKAKSSNTVKLTVDHVYPRKLGGKNDKNIVTACHTCNARKGSMLLTKFIKKYNIKITKRISQFL